MKNGGPARARPLPWSKRSPLPLREGTDTGRAGRGWQALTPPSQGGDRYGPGRTGLAGAHPSLSGRGPLQAGQDGAGRRSPLPLREGTATGWAGRGWQALTPLPQGGDRYGLGRTGLAGAHPSLSGRGPLRAGQDGVGRRSPLPLREGTATGRAGRGWQALTPPSQGGDGGGWISANQPDILYLCFLRTSQQITDSWRGKDVTGIRGDCF